MTALNGTRRAIRPLSVNDLHETAKRRARSDGKAWWVVTMDKQLRIVEPQDFVLHDSHEAEERHYIERVAYSPDWRYEGRLRRD